MRINWRLGYYQLVYTVQSLALSPGFSVDDLYLKLRNNFDPLKLLKQLLDDLEDMHE